MNDITRGNEAHGEDRNPPQHDIALVLFLASTELIHEMARSNVEQNHHHADEELIVVERIQIGLDLHW